jgi:hypothetical protein
MNDTFMKRLPGKTEDDGDSEDDDGGPVKDQRKKSKHVRPPCAHVTDGSEARLLSTYSSVCMLAMIAHKARNRGEQSHIRGEAVTIAWEQVYGDGAKISGDQIKLKDAASKKTTNHFVLHRMAVTQFTQHLFCKDLGTTRFDMMVQKMWGLNMDDPIVQNIWFDRADFMDTNSAAHGSMWENLSMTDFFRKGHWRRWWSKRDIHKYFCAEGKQAITERAEAEKYWDIKDPVTRIPAQKEQVGMRRMPIKTYGTLWRKLLLLNVLYDMLLRLNTFCLNVLTYNLIHFG